MSNTQIRFFAETSLFDETSFNTTQKLFLNIPVQNPDLSWFMRATLTDWMREAGKDLGLRRKTIHNSVSLLDRYLMFSSNFQRNKLQLLGVTCLFIASKVEEVEAPTLQNFSYMTTNTFNCQDISKMELEICKKVGWLLITGPYSKTQNIDSLEPKDPKPVFFIQKSPIKTPLGEEKSLQEPTTEIKLRVTSRFVRGNLNTIMGAMTEEWDFWLSETINNSQHKENIDSYLQMLSLK